MLYRARIPVSCLLAGIACVRGHGDPKFPLIHLQWGERHVSASIATRWLDGQLSYKINVVPDTEYVGSPPETARVWLYDDRGFIMVSFTTTLFPFYSQSGSGTQPLWRKYIRRGPQRLAVTGSTPCPTSDATTGACTRARYFASGRWHLEVQ
jgi:hypothetical protein